MKTTKTKIIWRAIQTRDVKKYSIFIMYIFNVINSNYYMLFLQT